MLKKRPSKLPATETGRLDGLVVANFGRHVLVEDDENRQHPCVPRGRKLRLACGDRVLWTPGKGSSRGIVEEILPRDCELTRPDRRGRSEVLAANLTQLLVVCAPRPAFDPFLIDRYLASAELMRIDAAIVCNKVELDDLLIAQDIRALCSEYERVGYPVVWTSAKQATGLDELTQQATGHTNILVGQSGVGKSSLLNELLPDVDARVGSLSTASGEGRHTTTVSMLHHLPGGGDLIDSPGVRDYAPHLDRDQDLSIAFIEFLEPGRDCHFSNCHHLDEPRCAVTAAVKSGLISERRYRSYRQLIRRQTSQNQPGG